MQYTAVNIRAYMSEDKATYIGEQKLNELLETAIDIVRRGKYFFGGVIAFLECENVDALMNFYTRNGFKYFNSRITSGDNPHKLNQLLKLI